MARSLAVMRVLDGQESVELLKDTEWPGRRRQRVLHRSVRMVSSGQEGVKQPRGGRVTRRRQVMRRASDSEEDIEFPEGTEWRKGCRVAVGRRTARKALSSWEGTEQQAGC